MRTLFREYDKDKSGLPREEVKKVFIRLLNDECFLGKVPNLSEGQLESLIESWPTTNIGKIPWIQIKERINTEMSWRLTDREKLTETIDALFK